MIIALTVNSIAFRLPNMLHVTNICGSKLASSNDAIAITEWIPSMMKYDKQMEKEDPLSVIEKWPEIGHEGDAYSPLLDINVRCA